MSLSTYSIVALVFLILFILFAIVQRHNRLKHIRNEQIKQAEIQAAQIAAAQAAGEANQYEMQQQQQPSYPGFPDGSAPPMYASYAPPTSFSYPSQHDNSAAYPPNGSENNNQSYLAPHSSAAFVPTPSGAIMPPVMNASSSGTVPSAPPPTYINAVKPSAPNPESDDESPSHV